MRKRAKHAARAIDEKPWLTVVDDWQRTIRPRLEATNEELQSVDVAQLDDAALADHLDRLMSYCRENFELHFYLHTYDLGPIGFLLAECHRWGIDAAEVMPALTRCITGDVRAGGHPARAARDRLRQRYGAGNARRRRHALPAGGEPSRAVLRAAWTDDGHSLRPRRAHARRATGTGARRAASRHAMTSSEETTRTRLPHGSESVCPPTSARCSTSCLADARATMDLRDDNGPNTVELPVGILRYALLEAGRRAMSSGRINGATLTFDLEPSEVVPFVRDGAGPSGDELEARARRRHADAQLTPPLVLGPTEVTPPLEVLSPPHQTFIDRGADRSRSHGHEDTGPAAVRSHAGCRCRNRAIPRDGQGCQQPGAGARLR